MNRSQRIVLAVGLPLVAAVQRALRENGQPLFDALANPGAVKQILREPYFDAAQVRHSELVDARRWADVARVLGVRCALRRVGALLLTPRAQLERSTSA